MPAYLRFDIVTKSSITPYIYEFATESGLKDFTKRNLPANATNIDCWWEPAPGIQKGFLTLDESCTPWWDEAKSDYPDGYDYADHDSIEHSERA